MYGSAMRTTVTLEQDVADAVRGLMAEQGLGFKAALNELVRRGAHPNPAEPFRTKARPMGVPPVNLDKALALAASLEDEELVAKMRAGR